ncbi:MAG: hypothetical protein RRY22_04945 [Bacilli bacterium]
MINVSQLLKQAKTIGINSQKISEVEKMANKYGLFDTSGNINGSLNVAKKVIEDNGGMGIVENAIKKANSPILKSFLGKMGINTDMINNAVNELKTMNNDINENKGLNSGVSNITNRLNKLK